MRAILTITLHALRILLRDKTAFIWMLLVPCVYIFVFGSAFKSGSDPAASKAYLAIYNQDGGFLSERFVDGIRSESIAIDSLIEYPQEPVTRLLVIPDSFTTNLLNAKKVELFFDKKNGTNIEAEAAAEMAVRKSYFRLLADLSELKMEETIFEQNEFAVLDTISPKITVKTSFAGKHTIIPSGFDHQVPANIVMFTLLILFLYSGSTMLDEKTSGALRRIKIAPIGFAQLFTGKLLNVLIIGLIQIGLLLFIGHFVFGVYYGNSVISLVLLCILFASCVGAMGLCLGFLLDNEERLVGTAIILSLVMAAVSGCWWPAEVSPKWMQNFSMLLPSGLALKSFQQLISYGNGFAEIWKNLAALLGMTVLFSILLARLLRKSD
jgi:ABC-2 type transport system permease protein